MDIVIDGVANSNLYVARIAGKIAGSIILNLEPVPTYSKAQVQLA